MYHAIVFLPLLAFLVVGSLGRLLGDRPSQWITCGAVITSALLSLLAFWQVALGGQPVRVDVGSWIVSGTFDVSWALRIDQLTAVMLVVVNGVSALVHVYSV